jgi:hypothetical protein
MQPIKRSRLSLSSSTPSSLMDIVGGPLPAPPLPQQNPHPEGTVEWYTFEINTLVKKQLDATRGGPVFTQQDKEALDALERQYERLEKLQQQQPRTLLFFLRERNRVIFSS